jgi:hypothetical protein
MLYNVNWESRTSVTKWAGMMIAKGITVEELVEAVINANEDGYNAGVKAS